ncbi:CRT10 domain containing protein [Pyrenophora tritici-repentis]|nr:CRT10 domain containing protein [Pyrenophora tritici-repentis]KAI1534107.1 CRT10 domain containing protein [Pyrenophora tritici-repentis]KAI1540079.1 CRT10 domain containing protein [Pyrenophora tritici-repentis]KAI1557541.1 CRT10 domain containing protein [Pyrenophora tritici-repentis]KAI1575366.1 CRT10 domain containing protein [Pyrenophora tritici-repentis]
MFPNHALAPQIREWRCDLTALSQRYNIYLVASNDVIHVYQPSFPDQSLSEPELVIHPPSTGQTGPGIFADNHRSINRILVDYLGNEEILLLARDDGDVVGYRTEEIHRALERRTTKDEPASEDDIHCFLLRNVGASAWGLAVHREARIIAISANTHCITVIAYALALRDADPTRETENVFTLQARGNIPSITFNDESGNFLLSCSIDGETILWNLRDRTWVSLIKVGFCLWANKLEPPKEWVFGRGNSCGCPDAQVYIHGNWGAIALDTRCAYELTLEEETALEPKSLESVFLDVTAHKTQFTIHESCEHLSGLSCYFSDESESESETEESDMDIQLAAVQEALSSDAAPRRVRQPLSEPYCSIKPNSESAETAKEIQMPSNPFLIITKEEIFLFQSPQVKQGQSRPECVVTMRRPLHPGEWSLDLVPEDRHCYFAQIPELGVFLVGSPIGRVGVFTLYWTKDEGNPQPRYGFKLEYLLPFREKNENMVVGMYLESRLAGVAVAPVQGMFDQTSDPDPEDREEQVLQPRRWRVLLHYTDSMVLSFELSKRKTSEAPSLDEIIV